MYCNEQVNNQESCNELIHFKIPSHSLGKKKQGFNFRYSETYGMYCKAEGSQLYQTNDNNDPGK